MVAVAEGLEWKRVYFTRGPSPRHSSYKSAVTDPPNSGWSLAFVLPGERRSTIFSPYTLQAHTVPNACGEISTAQEPGEDFRPEAVRAIVEARWRQYQAFGWQRDYDTCALVMRRLGWDVPAQVMTGGGEDTQLRGGKDTGPALLKPVKASSKRGRFLAWFLAADGSRSVREAMAEFSMTRSNALSYLYMLRKDHGIGYELVGDVATVTLPAGCDCPFDDRAHGAAGPAGEIGGTTSARRASEDAPDDDDDWLK